ncbi:hypothetical protein [Shimazuella alba]|nr:hypothetical protein [Shimazuella alba]
MEKELNLDAFQQAVEEKELNPANTNFIDLIIENVGRTRPESE